MALLPVICVKSPLCRIPSLEGRARSAGRRHEEAGRVTNIDLGVQEIAAENRKQALAEDLRSGGIRRAVRLQPTYGVAVFPFRCDRPWLRSWPSCWSFNWSSAARLTTSVRRPLRTVTRESASVRNVATGDIGRHLCVARGGCEPPQLADGRQTGTPQALDPRFECVPTAASQQR